MLWRVMVRHAAAALTRHAARSGSRGRGRTGQPIAGSGPSRAGRAAAAGAQERPDPLGGRYMPLDRRAVGSPSCHSSHQTPVIRRPHRHGITRLTDSSQGAFCVTPPAASRGTRACRQGFRAPGPTGTHRGPTARRAPWTKRGNRPRPGDGVREEGPHSGLGDRSLFAREPARSPLWTRRARCILRGKRTRAHGRSCRSCGRMSGQWTSDD
jgi:hypothetical protein